MLRVAYMNLVAWKARHTIREELNAPDSTFTVLVNGKPPQNSPAVLAALRAVHLRMSHHTSPTHQLPIVIRNDGTVLELTFARDSGDKHEYWIFWTREAGRNGLNEIGRIETPIFDNQ